MNKIVLSTLTAVVLSAGSAFAADLPVKARPVVAAAPSAWDLAFGSSLASDYVFRGITQTNHKPGVSAYFEPRYNINPDLQLYVGVSGENVSFTNQAAAEVDFYAGVRPTFGKLGLDFGAWYYYYPGGQCKNTAVFGADCTASLPTFNTLKKDVSFWEVYAKASYAVTDAFTLGANFYYTNSFLHSGASGEYVSGTAKYVGPAFASGATPYISGEYGYQFLGTTDSFYGLLGTATGPGIKYKDYATWNVGLGWTYKVFTVDFRYSDTNLNKGDCNAFTGDFTAGGAGNVTAINPGGLGSNWCGARFIGKLSADLTLNTNIK